MAAIPLANASASSAPSRSATEASNASTVGFAHRVYTYPAPTRCSDALANASVSSNEYVEERSSGGASGAPSCSGSAGRWTARVEKPLRRRSPLMILEVDDGAGQRARDALDGLDLGDDELAEVVDVRRARAHDDVVRARDVLGGVDAFDVADLACNLSRFADLGLYEDVCLDRWHVAPSVRLRC